MNIYSSKRTRRAVIDTVFFRALSQLSSAIGFILLVRGMPEHDFGILSLMYAIVPVISTVASFGLEQTLRRYQPEFLQSGNTAAARWLVRFVTTARLGANLMVLAVLLAAWSFVAPIFKLGPYRLEFALFCLPILLHFQSRILQLALASNMLHRYSVGSVALLSVVKLPAYLALWTTGTFNLTNAILADTFASAVAYVFLLIQYRRNCPYPAATDRFRPDVAERRRLFRYGLLNNFNDAGSFVLSDKSDSFFLAAFLNAVAVGVYAFYSRLGQMVAQLQPMQMFATVIQPVFFAVPKGDADEKIPRYFSMLLNTGLILQWPALAFVTAFHSEIVAMIFGGKFQDASMLLPVIVMFGMLETISRPVTLVAQYEEKAGIILLSKFLALYNLLALFVLVPLAGVLGAVIATGSAALLKNLFIWWHVRNRARWLNVVGALISGTIIWGGVVLVCLAIKSFTDLPDWINVALGLIIAAPALLIYLRSPALSASDRQILTTVMRGREARLLMLAGVVPRNSPNAGK